MCPFANSGLPNPHATSYAVSPTVGFCPTDPLPDDFTRPLILIGCSSWLAVARSIRPLLASGELRRVVEALPYIHYPGSIATFEDNRLAYVSLTFLAHAYIWGDHIAGEAPVDILPAQIAAPLLEVCDLLKLQPCLTYTSTIWNWMWTDSTRTKRDVAFSFTGTRDEAHFYLCLLEVETAGGDALRLGTEAAALSLRRDSEQVARRLWGVAEALDRCKVELCNVRTECSPSVFFTNMRPYLGGFKSSTFPRGVFFRSSPTDASSGSWMEFQGATGGQSPLFQAIDNVLGIRHCAPSTKDYVQEMREAMWRPHAQFISELGQLPPLVAFVSSDASSTAVMDSYNAAITALKKWRDSHLQIVTLYIIQPALRSGQRDKGVTGTAAGNLCQLLKSMRDATTAALVHQKKVVTSSISTSSSLSSASSSSSSSSTRLVSSHAFGRGFSLMFLTSFMFAMCVCAAKAYETL